MHEYALFGSGIRAIEGGTWPSAFEPALAAMVPPAGVSVGRIWSEGERPELLAMTRLTVVGGSLDIDADHRLLLVEVDLSGLERLPEGCELGDCLWLERVRLPVALEELPSDFFYQCASLSEVNWEELRNLKVIGKGAFWGCLRLHRVAVPAVCQIIDFYWSGVRSLDLRGISASSVDIDWCGQLERIILPIAFEGDLIGRLNVSLSHVTMGDFLRDDEQDWLDEIRPCQLRFMCQNSWGLGNAMAGLSRAFALGEIGSVGGRQSRPSLPC
jgi:hypothetical protein